MDSKIEKARLGAQGDASNWIWNAAVNTLADFARIGSDTFRLGSGIGCALFNDQASTSDKAWAVASDVFRGASIAGAGFTARAAAKAIFRAAKSLKEAGKAARAGQGINEGSKSFFSGTKYTNKVLGQIKKGDFHAFPESVKAFEKSGTITTIRGGDGITRQMLKIPGSYRGRQGFFEFIKEADGTINHRFFRPSPRQ